MKSANSAKLLQCLPFTLDERTFAVPLDMVERVARMVAVTPLPGAPEVVRGIIDIAGEFVPVVDPRRRFDLPLVRILPYQQLVVLRTPRRRMAMQVDGTGEVFEWTGSMPSIEDCTTLWPGLELVAGVARLGEEMVMLHDPDRFFLPEEEEMLDAAMAGTQAENS
ncbi:chemotaxis protein CheW [Megalodesulfovibrio paquesii]